MLIKSPDDSKLRLTTNAWEDKSRIWNDLAKLEKQPGGEKKAPPRRQFNQNKCKIALFGAHTGQHNPKELITHLLTSMTLRLSQAVLVFPDGLVPHMICQRPCTSLKQPKFSQFPPPSQKPLVKITFTSQEISCAATVISVNAILITKPCPVGRLLLLNISIS